MSDRASRGTVSPVVALAAVAAALGGGCDSGDPLAEDPTPGPQCGMPFSEYDAGPSVAGIERTARVSNCGKRPFVTYVYGTCAAESDQGCAPPLEVQSWSACHRAPSAAPAGHDVELRRGAVTVVVFARSDRLAQAAVAALRKARPPDSSLAVTPRLRECGAR